MHGGNLTHVIFKTAAIKAVEQTNLQLTERTNLVSGLYRDHGIATLLELNLLRVRNIARLLHCNVHVCTYVRIRRLFCLLHSSYMHVCMHGKRV